MLVEMIQSILFPKASQIKLGGALQKAISQTRYRD